MVRDQQPFWENIVRVPAQDIKTHPKNPREGDVDAIAEMIRENGWHGVLVVQRSTGYIVVGNHRYKAGLKVGVDTFPVHYVDIDDMQALRILLADNRASDMATYDDERLLQAITELTGKAFVRNELDLQVQISPDAAVAVLANQESTPEEREEARRALTSGDYRGTGYRKEDVAQLALELLPDPNDTEYRTPEVMAERYEQTAVRQVMLIMNEEEYAQMVPALKRVRDDKGLETNTDVVMHLLRLGAYLDPATG